MNFFDKTPKSEQMLPLNYKPNSYSVICGRGKDCFNHVGNQYFRKLIDENLQQYMNSDSKVKKSMLVTNVFDKIQHGGGGQNGEPGRFVKQDPKTMQWLVVGDHVAREKIGQQFRVATNQYLRNQMKKSSKPTTVTNSTAFAASRFFNKSDSSLSGSSTSPMIVGSTSAEEMIMEKIIIPPRNPLADRKVSSSQTLTTTTTTSTTCASGGITTPNTILEEEEEEDISHGHYATNFTPSMTSLLEGISQATITPESVFSNNSFTFPKPVINSTNTSEFEQSSGKPEGLSEETAQELMTMPISLLRWASSVAMMK